MSATTCVWSDDQFLCSICLDSFTDPVSTSCGHNFCKACLTQYWNNNVQCVCPLCKNVFVTRPELHVNTFISELAAQFRQAAEYKASSISEQPAAKPGEVQCDFCTETKAKAIMSCLRCEASFCQTHLEPHLTRARLRLHPLIHPVDNLEDRMCKQHKKPLELFCKTDQTCVCSLCPVVDHKNHEFVPLGVEYGGKKAELGRCEAEIQQKIQQRQLKIQEFKRSAKLSREAADRENADGVQVFTALQHHLEKAKAHFIKTVEEKTSTEKQAECFIKVLQQEISELMKRAAEVRHLSSSGDLLHLLQSIPSIYTAPPTKDWTKVRVYPRSHEGSVVNAVGQLVEAISKEVMKLQQVQLKRVQKFAVDVTLDPDTAHPNLVLSDDAKQVLHGDAWRKVPDKPQRFDKCVHVLGKQSFSSGRFYFEVQVKGKTEWNLGVAREEIRRKGRISLSPEEGCWAVMLSNGKFFALDGPSCFVRLAKSKPEKVGVFVDYDKGLVSFYDVQAATLIFSFTGCTFTHNLLPYFSPSANAGGKNSAPLVISAVHSLSKLQ